MSADLLDRRVLGALRFVDAVTGVVVTEPLRVSAEGVSWIRNRRGDYVIADAPGLGHHTLEFSAPPSAPAVGSVSVEFEVEDPRGRYLPRRGAVRLPRDPDPESAEPLQRAVDVPLFASPTARLMPGWAVVRASVAGPEPGTGLPGALIRVLRQPPEAGGPPPPGRGRGGGEPAPAAGEAEVIGRALSDGRGEALVAVDGIPVTTFGEGDGPVLATEVAALLEVIWDPEGGAVSDPEALEAQAADPARRDALLIRSTPALLASGRVAAMVL